jgi:integrase
MSSLTRETKTRDGYRLRVYTASGRRSIWLGAIAESEAVAVQRHVDEIVAAQTADLPIPRATVAWLDRIPRDLRAKLTAITGASQTIATAIDLYLDARRADLADSTYDDRSRSLEILAAAIGTRRIESVTLADIETAHNEIGLSSSTRGKIAAAWRAFFNWCIDCQWIADNPARRLSTTIDVRDKTFVSIETARKLLAVCSAQMRVAIALSRWGGIRVSSELRTLDWSRVDRDRGRIRILDAKRGTDRDVPIFPEIAEQLDQHGPGPLCGDLVDLSHATMTTRLLDAMDLAHIEPWHAPWHSMRATRETELIAEYGIATASKWIGNSAVVALKSYSLVSDDAWNRATNRTPKSE